MQRVRLKIATALLCVFCSSGCLLRSHRVEPHRAQVPLRTATRDELVAKIDAMSAAVRSMNATVDIDTTVGGEKKGRVTEYQQIRGYILAQKPARLRMIGLLPIVRNKAFDMVSDGDGFKLWIPPKNRFVTGSNQLTRISPNALENLRPQVIYGALLMPAIDPATEIAVLEEGKQEVVVDEHTHKTDSQPNYHIVVIRQGQGGQWHLYRKIYFNRADLEPYRQTIYDEKGAIATDAVYSAPQEYDGGRFPSLIEIERPQEEYSITLKMIKLTLNKPLADEQFQMEAPSGATVTVLK